MPEPLTSVRLADIAARALWNPANVSTAEVQVLAASLRSLMLDGARGPEAVQRDGADGRA